MLMTVRAGLSGVNVVFAHDTEMALAGTAGLVNTSPGIADGAGEGGGRTDGAGDFTSRADRGAGAGDRGFASGGSAVGG